MSFTKAVVLEEVVKKTDHAVPPLSNTHSLINEVVYLCMEEF